MFALASEHSLHSELRTGGLWLVMDSVSVIQTAGCRPTETSARSRAQECCGAALCGLGGQGCRELLRLGSARAPCVAVREHKPQGLCPAGRAGSALLPKGPQDFSLSEGPSVAPVVRGGGQGSRYGMIISL